MRKYWLCVNQGRHSLALIPRSAAIDRPGVLRTVFVNRGLCKVWSWFDIEMTVELWAAETWSVESGHRVYCVNLCN
jgi:hypothetical protein